MTKLVAIPAVDRTASCQRVGTSSERFIAVDSGNDLMFGLTGRIGMVPIVG